MSSTIFKIKLASPMFVNKGGGVPMVPMQESCSLFGVSTPCGSPTFRVRDSLGVGIGDISGARWFDFLNFI